MELEILDNKFADDWLMHAYYYACQEIPWSLNNIANRYQYPVSSWFCEGTHLMLGNSELNMEHEMVNAPFKLFNRDYNDAFTCERVQSNMQGYKCDSTFHTDSTEYTLLFYPHYKWEKEWGGELECKINNEIKKVELKPGRLILINSLIPHRALGTNEIYRYRISYAYRLHKIESNYNE